MSKGKKQSEVKRKILQLEEFSKNDECGISVAGDVKVIVFYNGINYKVRISIPKRIIKNNILEVQNSKFDLYIRFEDADYSEFGEYLYIELKRIYNFYDRLKNPNGYKEVNLEISAKKYKGNIILQPDLFIPENWKSSLQKLELLKVCEM